MIHLHGGHGNLHHDDRDDYHDVCCCQFHDWRFWREFFGRDDYHDLADYHHDDRLKIELKHPF